MTDISGIYKCFIKRVLDGFCSRYVHHTLPCQIEKEESMCLKRNVYNDTCIMCAVSGDILVCRKNTIQVSSNYRDIINVLPVICMEFLIGTSEVKKVERKCVASVTINALDNMGVPIASLLEDTTISCLFAFT